MKKKIFLISSILLVIDQLIKVIVRESLKYQVEYFIIPKFFYLTYVKNTGGAFSILNNNPLLLAFVGVIVFVFLIRYIQKKKNIKLLEVISYSLLISGIVGNLVDRLIFSSVTDYIGLIFGSYYYPIFNFADACIVIGIIIIIFIEIRGEKDGNRSN